MQKMLYIYINKIFDYNNNKKGVQRHVYEFFVHMFLGLYSYILMYSNMQKMSYVYKNKIIDYNNKKKVYKSK